MKGTKNSPAKDRIMQDLTSEGQIRTGKPLDLKDKSPVTNPSPEGGIEGGS